MSNAPTAKEIRLYCDGELSPPEAAAIESKLRDHPQANALAGFEQDLKKRVATTLTDGSAPPAGLADQIREALAGEADTVGTNASEPAPHRANHPTSHRAWWQAPLRANAFAVAASLVLVAGAVLFGIFGQPIDALRQQPLTDIASQAAAAVAAEHVVAVNKVDGPVRSARYRTLKDARRGLAGYLGEAGCVYDLSDLGYKFVGGDNCVVPGCESGCHLIYKRTRGEPGLISLHVVPIPGRIQPKGTAGLNALPLTTDKIARSANCRMDVLVWNHGDRFYLLSVCIPNDAEQIALRMQETQLEGRP
jgi:anti-sigma factor RsiW